MRIALAILTVALLAGCATTVPTTAELKPMPADRQFAAKTPVPNGATVTILRDKAFVASGVDWRILIDGTLAAQLGWGEYAVFYVAPGERLIEIRHPSPTIGMPGDSATLQAESGASYYYRINADAGVRLLRTTAEAIGGAPK